MRKKFPGYCRLTESEFLQLWGNCLFAFDANVLLNLYRYTPETKDSLINIMHKVSDRIWLPFQAALEYHRGRITVIQQQSKAYDEIRELVKKGHGALSGELKKYTKHPSIHINGILEKSNKSLAEIEDTLTQLQKNHPDLLEDDPIQTAVLKLFDGKVGTPTSPAELLDIYKQGEERYRLKIPPGYADKQKDGPDKYGDLVIWFQLLAKSKENKLPMIFVTDDRKEDWWLKIEGKAIGPQPELVQEISTQSGIMFYMYSADPFMEHAKKYLKYKVEKKAINEVREVRQGDEIIRQATKQAKKDDLMRKLGLMGTSGYSGFATDEILRHAKEQDDLMRKLGLMGTSGYSGSATDEVLRQVKEEALSRGLGLMGTSGYSGSAIDEVLRQAKVAAKPEEIDISDMGKKDK